MKKRLYFAFLMAIATASCSSALGFSDKQKEDEELQKQIDSVDVPTIEKSLYESALAAIESLDYPKAEQYLLQLMKDHSDKTIYAAKYAEMGRKMGKCKTSIGIYNKILEKEPDNLDYQEGKALCQLEVGEFKEAGRAFTDIIGKDPKRWKSINASGLIFASRKKFNEANQYFSLAAEVSGNNPSVMNNLALNKALLGNYPDAIKILEEASGRANSEGEQKRRIDLNLALVYGISGNLDAAKQVASKHLSEAQAFNNMGIYSEIAHQPDLAKTYLNKALTSTTLYYDRAWENLEKIEKH